MRRRRRSKQHIVGVQTFHRARPQQSQLLLQRSHADRHGSKAKALLLYDHSYSPQKRMLYCFWCVCLSVCLSVRMSVRGFCPFFPPAYPYPFPRWRRAVRSSLELILVLPFISARCNIYMYISRLCYDVSVRLSVTEVHWRIIANLGFKFRSHFTSHCGRRAACGRIISRHASQC